MNIEGAPPRELVVDAKPAPGDSTDSGGSAMAPVAVPVLGAGLLAKFVSPSIGLVTLGLAVVALLLLRKPREGRFVLRMDDHALEITRERTTEPAVRIALADLLDILIEDGHRCVGST